MANTYSGIVIRDVLPHEHYCEEKKGKAIKKGTVVFLCNECTYGCISYQGVATTFDSNGGYPFFEMPRDSIIWDK